MSGGGNIPDLSMGGMANYAQQAAMQQMMAVGKYYPYPTIPVGPEPVDDPVLLLLEQPSE